MGKKIKSVLFDNFHFKLLALMIAFLMWFVVMNMEDSIVSKNISDIPVEMINGETILENGNLYNVTDGDKVDIVVRGPRSIVEDLESYDFEATADLSHLSVTNSTTIKVVTNSNVSASKAKKITITPINQYVTLSIEEEAEKSVPVRVITTGEVAEGYAPGAGVSTPNMITVKGPESVLSTIVEARAVVDISGADKEVVKVANVGCIDGYGSAVEKDNITLSAGTVSVSIPVYKTKEVPVNVSTAGAVRDGYGVKEVNFEPSTITIAGDAKLLEDVESIDISDVVITDATESLEKNVEIAGYLPADVIVADDTVDIAVSVTIEQMSESEITINKSDIKVFGQNKDYSYTVISPDSLKVKISGFSEDIDGKNASDLDAKVNVSEIGPGERDVEVSFNESDVYTIKDSYSVKVEVKKTE